MKYSTILFIIFITPTIFAQSYKSGLMLEYVSFNTNYTLIKSIGEVVTDSSTENRYLGGGYFSYSGKIDLGENFDLEFRPGIVLTSAQLSGIQLGLFLRKRVNDFFGIAGYSWIDNLYSPNVKINYEKTAGDIYSVTFGLGYSLSKRFNVMINYQKKIGDKSFGGGLNTDYKTKHSISYNSELNSIFTIGAEINLN